MDIMRQGIKLSDKPYKAVFNFLKSWEDLFLSSRK